MRNILFRLLYQLVRSTRPRHHVPPRTILVLQYQMPLGCCVHGTPLYAAIKRRLPGSTLIVATRGLGYDTLRHDPNIDHLLATANPMVSPKAQRPVQRELRGLLRERGLAPDFVLQDASSRAGSFALFALLLRLAPTAGFGNAPALYDHHLSYDPSLSLIDNNLRLTAALGQDAQSHLEPAVYFTKGELAAAESYLGHGSAQPTVAFVLQGSGGQRTGWHDERFAAVIRHVESKGFRTLYLGTAAEEPNIERLRALASSQGLSLAGHTTIPELAAVLAMSDAMITLDTGTMHVGRAVDVPMVVLAPSWQKPLEWLPLGKANVRILRGHDRSDVPADYRLDEITSADVVAAFDELMRTYPASASARAARAARLLSTARI